MRTLAKRVVHFHRMSKTHRRFLLMVREDTGGCCIRMCCLWSIYRFGGLRRNIVQWDTRDKQSTTIGRSPAHPRTQGGEVDTCARVVMHTAADHPWVSNVAPTRPYRWVFANEGLLTRSRRQVLASSNHEPLCEMESRKLVCDLLYVHERGVGGKWYSIPGSGGI